jgi:hypothetical protein
VTSSGRKKRARATKGSAAAAAPAAPEAVPAPGARTAALGLASVTVLVSVAVPGGPFAFLPAALRWPLAGLVVFALWWPWLEDQGRRLPARLPAVLEALALTLVLGGYFLLKLAGLHASGTDENVYFYSAVRLSQGAVPYRDFFFAHPPMHLVVPALIFKITGFGIPVAKAIPVLAQATAGLFLYLTVRRASRALAAAALLLHLLAYQVLMGSTDMNGENIMSAFLLAALFTAVRGRLLLAGVLAGFALGTGLYALAGVIALAVAAGCTSRRALGRFGLGLLASFGGLVLVFRVLGGPGFTEGVFSYHLAKPVKGERVSIFTSASPIAIAGAYLHNLGFYLSSSEFKKQVFFHGPVFLAALVSVGLVLGRAVDAGRRQGFAAARAVLTARDLLAGSPEGLAKLGLLAGLLFTAQWAGLNEVYDFYSVPMFAFLSLPAAYALWDAFRTARSARRPTDLRVPALVLALFALHLPMADSLNGRLWGDEARDAGQVVRYEWREPAALGGPAALARSLFFVDERVKGTVTPPYRHYLWNKLLTFSTVDEIAAYVRERTAPEETIAGASTIAPLVALRAGRRLAADEADTNNKRFVTGVLTDEQFFAKACRDRLRYLVVAPRSHFGGPLMATNPTAREGFALEREFADPQLLHGGRKFPITLYRRRDVPGLPAGTVCAVR